jgi:hypothetical protein
LKEVGAGSDLTSLGGSASPALGLQAMTYKMIAEVHAALGYGGTLTDESVPERPARELDRQ